jgi:hypothetical protein
MEFEVPSELTEGAFLRDKEYAWELSAFPVALLSASGLGYACLGGQIWFLLPNNSDYDLYEPFWLEANATDRAAGQAWSEYARDSCAEVLARFNALIGGTDFDEEAKKFDSLQSSFRVLFNAYFVTESEYSSLGLQNLSH